MRENTALPSDPMFNKQQAEERTAQGTATVPMLSVNAQILSAYERTKNAEQSNYEMRMWVVDLRTGEVVFSANAARGLAPASAEKLAVSFAALRLLGVARDAATGRDEFLTLELDRHATTAAWHG